MTPVSTPGRSTQTSTDRIRAYGAVSDTFSGGTANYNGLQTGFVYRSGPLQLNVAYTFSKVLTDVNQTAAGPFGGISQTASFQNPRNPRAEYGPPDYDRTQVFTTAWVYALPFFVHSGNVFAREIFGGWNFTGLFIGESGFRLTPTMALGTARLATRPNQVGAIHVTGVHVTGDRFNWISPTIFQQPAYGFFGNASPGSIPGPREITANLALGKSFPITERVNLQFRVEAFNVANHPNFATINAALGSTTFGRATTANDPRILEGMLRFSF